MTSRWLHFSAILWNLALGPKSERPDAQRCLESVSDKLERLIERFVPYLISFSGWLGITGETRWEYLIEGDLQVVSDAAIGFCKRFFDAAPKLLDGLDPEKMAPDKTV